MDKGLKILYSMFWNSNGWTKNEPTEEDYELAKSEGYVFNISPVLSHDETHKKLRKLIDIISPNDVANAFLYSLSTRQLQYRSALGSYYYAKAIPEHSHENDSACYYCNWLPVENKIMLEREYSGYNVLNFERYKWGGVRHTHPEYALFDLEEFLKLPKVEPQNSDWMILKSILGTIKELPSNKKVGAYRELITKKKLLKSNKNEVKELLNILGICGILSSSEAPCYQDYFADTFERSPREHTNDFTYPVNWWYASDGINEEYFKKVFGINYCDLENML